MGERSYLAIGDVLALLREEFPDVTISKIRFLESRGLLVPERTPSGYRKFYEPDVERLRWILRQQREHFLPLKVIKGRLDHGMSDPAAPAQPLFEMGDPPPEPEPEPEPVLVGAPAAVEPAEEGAGVPRAPFTPIGVVGSPGTRTPTRAEPSGQANGEGAPRAHASTAGRAGSSREEAPGAQGSGEGSPEPEVADTVPAVQEAGPPKRPRRHSAPPGVDAGSQTRAGEGPVADAARQDEAKPAPRPATRSTAGLPGAGLAGASLTVAEVANASGLDIQGVEELENFGLIACRMVAGVPCYDEEAVLVAKLAAGFAPYGIEARHLRIFKHAADRQTGLYAQVITPLLRQRNPEARARAVEGLSELAELGEALMRCFSQATLRELTGG